jgi:RNA ligase (TIGR02306 family)
LGEAFGSGVQDLAYGAGHGAKDFRSFAAAVRDEQDNTRPGGWRWLDDAELEQVLSELGIVRVPVVYRGPFTSQALELATNGRELVSGQQAHLREGVVVVPVIERISQELPTFRVALKSVSPAYLSRKGGTEYA